MKLGAITVGQSPRTDLIPDMLPVMPGIEVIEAGALDGMTSAEVAERFSPEEGDTVLVSRMRDGSQARFAEKFIIGLLQERINSLENLGAEGILMLCTGKFPEFRHRVPMYFPNALLRSFTAVVARERRLGAMSPDPAQMKNCRKRWNEAGVADVVNDSASPYLEFGAVLEASMRLKEKGAELIVLDCMGYTTTMKEKVREATGLSVILPRTVAARAMCELYGAAR